MGEVKHEHLIRQWPNALNVCFVVFYGGNLTINLFHTKFILLHQFGVVFDVRPSEITITNLHADSTCHEATNGRKNHIEERRINLDQMMSLTHKVYGSLDWPRSL